MEHFDELWREELQCLAASLTADTTNIPSKETHYFNLERPLLYSAFVVRKLIEDVAVTDKARSASLEVRQHVSSREGAEIFLEIMAGPLEVQDHFDLTNDSTLRISYSDLASEIVHSDGLIWVPNNGRIQAFMVFSYRNALNRLLVVKIDQYVGMLRSIISDKPTEWWIEKDLNTSKIIRHAK